MDQLRALRTFVCVVDQGGFAAAARALDMAPAGVTRLVSGLERSLGTRLLHRTTRSLTLTAVGTQYLARARQILADLDEANALASATSAELQGTLRVAGPPAVLVQQLLPRLPAFCARHPGVHFEFGSVSLLATPLEQADLTLLLSGPKPLDGEFVARLLAHSEIVLCATPAYLARHGRPQHPADMLGHELLTPSFTREERVWRLRRRDGSGDAVIEVPRPSGPPLVATESGELLLAAARAGLGVVGTLSMVVADALRSGALERVLPDWNLGSYALYAAMPSRQYLPQRTKVFVDFLVQEFGGEPRDPWLPAQAA